MKNRDDLIPSFDLDITDAAIFSNPDSKHDIVFHVKFYSFQLAAQVHQAQLNQLLYDMIWHDLFMVNLYRLLPSNRFCSK